MARTHNIEKETSTEHKCYRKIDISEQTEQVGYRAGQTLVILPWVKHTLTGVFEKVNIEFLSMEKIDKGT